MSKSILLNPVTIGGVRYLPGKVIDSAVVAASVITAIAAAGGVLIQSADPNVSAASALVQARHPARGIDESEMSGIMISAALASAYAAAVQTQHFTLTTAQIKALTSGTAFNVGSALPTGAVLIGYSVSWVAVTGGSLSAVALIIGDATTANSVLTSTSVFTTGKTSAGAFQPRSAAQIQATLTASSDTLANATAGSLVIDLFYSVPAIAA